MNFSLINKLAFLANLAFILSIVMRFYPFLQGSWGESMVLVVGLVISPAVNLLVSSIYLFQLYKGERPYAHFMQAFNTCSFGCQIILFLFFSGWLPLSNIHP